MGGTYNMSMIGLLVGVHIFLTFLMKIQKNKSHELMPMVGMSEFSCKKTF
jgi:hypothetical protein